MEKLVHEFTAIDDEGKEYKLLVYQEFISVATRKNPSGLVPGLKRIVTEFGDSVNRQNKGEYVITQSGTVLRSSHPDAP